MHAAAAKGDPAAQKAADTVAHVDAAVGNGRALAKSGPTTGEKVGIAAAVASAVAAIAALVL